MDEWLDLPELIERAQELIELGLYEESLELLDQYKEMHPNEWEIYFLYSRIHTEQNHPDKAIPYLHKGLRFNKTNPDCLLGLFYAYSMMNQVEKAGKYLLRAEKYSPDNDLILTSLIWYYGEINELAKAIGYFERLKKDGNANPETYRNAGLVYEKAGETENAEQCFITALDINPQYDEVRDLLADHYIFQEKTDKSIELYKNALKESPRNIRLMSRLVFSYSQAGNFTEATELSKQMIEVYPNSPVGYVDMAYVHLNKDEFDKAIESAEIASNIAPIDAESYRVKGIAYSEKGENDKANLAFIKAIELDPTNTEIMRDYYHHLRKIGKNEEMEKMVHQVIDLEKPYCVEDYWFLADYFREMDLDTKAFHYLVQAYKNMPNEKDLIPPMVDILLDRSHTKFSLKFLIRYVEKRGWNDVMDEFARHKRLQGKWSEEGIRFLRFWSQRSPDYRKYIFALFLKRFTVYAIIAISLLFLVILYLTFGIRGLLSGVLSYSLLTGGYFLYKHIKDKKGAEPPEEKVSKGNEK
jgi:tetratricopeptide (TPR) repeat protein